MTVRPGRLGRRRRTARGVRRARALHAARRRRRPDGVLRAVRPAAPRPGGRRHRGERRQPGPAAQGRRPRVAGVHARGARPAHRLPRDRPHPLQHDRRRSARRTPSRSSSRRCTARWRSPTTATSSTPQRCARSCSAAASGSRATSDTEVLTLMLAAAGGRTWEERLERTLPAWKGAYSLVILAADRVLAVRDPWGFRPLSVGRLPRGGLRGRRRRRARCTTLGCVEISEVQPGEIVTLQGAEMRRRQALAPAPQQARVHVRVRLLQPARQRVGRPQRPPRAPAARRAAGRRGWPCRRRRRRPRARLLDPRGDRLRPAQRPAVQRRADQEPLHRPDVHRADAGPARPRRGAQVQRPGREPRRASGS